MQAWDDPELDAIRRRHRELGERHLGGDELARDRAGRFCHRRWRRCAELGLLASCMGPAYGGQGRPVAHAVAALEGLGQGCRDGGLVYALTSQLFGVQMPLERLAGEELKQSYLPALIAGDLLIAHAFTEIGSGSDALSMAMRAEPHGAGYRLHGTKSFITAAPAAGLALVFARTDEGRSAFALTAFLVDLAWPGIRRGRELEKLGLRTIGMGEIVCDGVEVPASHVVAGEGAGMQVLIESTTWERALLLTAALGPMACQLEDAVARARSREQFGRPIGSFQQVSAKIADMTLRLHLCRLAIYDMAARLGRGGSARPLAQQAAMTKLFVSESYQQLNLDALQIFGVRGYLMDSWVQQALRDSLSATVYAGTSEILRNTIAKLAGLPVE
jgi:alkylation response protein AidB-like acyl-CoA dehydrogenase